MSTYGTNSAETRSTRHRRNQRRKQATALRLRRAVRSHGTVRPWSCRPVVAYDMTKDRKQTLSTTVSMRFKGAAQ